METELCKYVWHRSQFQKGVIKCKRLVAGIKHEIIARLHDQHFIDCCTVTMKLYTQID